MATDAALEALENPDPVYQARRDLLAALRRAGLAY